MTKVEVLSKEMEQHNDIMKEYSDKSEQLKKDLQLIEQFKKKNHPKELASVLSKRSNDVQKEGDKIRKQFQKNEIVPDQFIKEFIASRQLLYTNDIIR